MAALRTQRSWLLLIVLLGAVIVAAVFGSHGRSGGSTAQGRLLPVSFGYPSRVLPLADRIEVNNGWSVSSPTRTLEVYAGSQDTDHLNGLLVIERTGQLQRSIVLRGRGPLTIVKPLPLLQTLDASAAARISFVAADGAKGTLDLPSGHVSRLM